MIHRAKFKSAVADEKINQRRAGGSTHENQEEQDLSKTGNGKAGSMAHTKHHVVAIALIPLPQAVTHPTHTWLCIVKVTWGKKKDNKFEDSLGMSHRIVSQ